MCPCAGSGVVGTWVVELAVLLVVTLDAYPPVALVVKLLVALDVMLVEALSVEDYVVALAER